MAARDDDFFGEGTVDPFAGLAPMSPEDQQALEDVRRSQLRQSANNTANINAAADRGGPDYKSMTSAQLLSRKAAGEPISDEQIMAARQHEKLNHEAMNTPGYKALTYGILAAPSLITGGAAAFAPGGLGFGAGSGSIAAADAATAATESAAASATPIVPVVNEATGLAQAGPGFSQAAADSYNAAHGLTAAGTTSAATGATTAATESPWATASGYGKDLLKAAAPVLINEALGGRTKEEKALVAKQEQLAQEAKVRQGQQQDARMNQLGQQLLAFNPSNQRLAQMFGPSAAFTPEQMATMVQGQAPPNDPNIGNYEGTDQATLQAKREQIRRQSEFDQAEAARRSMMLGGIAPVGPGPAPIQMGAPQAPRRF